MTAEPADLERGRLFDQTADVYHDARPDYPSEVFELLERRCGLGPGSSVLEIGPGSGLATVPMLRRGARVVAVEPGPRLASELTSRTGGLPLEVLVSRFEDAVIDENSFDLCASATAFHWVDPAVGVAKAAAALRDSGWLAIWSTQFGDEARADPFHEALQPIVRAKAPSLTSERPRTRAEWADLVRSSDQFGDLEVHAIKWEGHHDARELRNLFSTFSPWLALPETQREDMLDEVERLALERFDNHVVRPYQTVLHLAPRVRAAVP